MAITREEAIKAKETGQLVVPEYYKGIADIKIAEIGTHFKIESVYEEGVSLVGSQYFRDFRHITLHEQSTSMPSEQPYKREMTTADRVLIHDAVMKSKYNGDCRQYYDGFADALSSLPSPEEIKAKDEAINILTKENSDLKESPTWYKNAYQKTLG